MRKKIRLAQSKDDLHDLGSDDLLSRLSDDILVSILSYLPLKDAAVTSKLSRRWRYLWCQRVCIAFEDNEGSGKIRREQDSSTLNEWNKYTSFCLAERNNYINWVNRIIRQHKSPIIDEFKICFDLDKNAKGAIRKWIEFAISKNVQRLELDLRQKNGLISYGWKNYVFPNKIFDRKCGSSSKRPSFNALVRPYATVMEIKFLKALILKRVDVDDEGLKKILSNCPVLEHLSIQGSCQLVKAKIDGEGLALKKLEIGGCSARLESIEICDSNIVSLDCWGSNCKRFPISLRLDNLQKLEKIFIRKCYSLKIINHMFCCLPNLRVLELSLFSTQRAIELLPFPELPKLKKLIINVEVREDVSLLVFTSLVEACPNLRRFKIELMSSMRRRKENREERQVAKKPHQHLEVVEISGYYGMTGHLELATYFIENGVVLKKLIIKPLILASPSADGTLEVENGPRYHAQQHLEPRTPVGLELVIL
ncbi:putative FBD-associated F-box protein At5g56700 isoform X2 [Cynara cardunculus var. scolymus]|uniref:FBD-like protein n=1 Tax=Cynara cardunculus var. scolymus TaxID=59895 RepID=A0A103YIW4_CYNCS|nr:putative FBD-associated F-box protein At5g56700 isoform X2 [Cynara cardunculus var. scolymus]KVI09956.1 FBD-like protein [Cynara cardunculus var. scolymus]